VIVDGGAATFHFTFFYAHWHPKKKKKKKKRKIYSCELKIEGFAIEQDKGFNSLVLRQTQLVVELGCGTIASLRPLPELASTKEV
jgi:hypothetical protein